MNPLLMTSVFVLVLTALANSETPTLPTLTHATEIRQLSPEQAGQEYPVRIRGVITGDVPSPDIFLQDATAGVYVEGSTSPTFPHKLGQLVEVEGVTGPGKFAPVIKERKLRILGEGTLPKARVYSFNELADGQLDSQWVTVRGIVRSVSIDRTSWRELTLAMYMVSGGGEFNVRVPIPNEQDFSSWVDSEVMIEGVCGSLFNRGRQLIGLLLYVPRLSFIRVETPARERIPFSALLRFSPGTSSRHRVRVQGTVTYQQRGSALFLESEGQGLRVLTRQDTPLEIGDTVEVLGFPSTGESAPILVDSVFHRLGRSRLAQPAVLHVEDPWEQFDGLLVEADARLLHSEVQADGERLLFQIGTMLFEALLPGGNGLSIPENSDVRVRGICLVRSGGLWSIPQSFRLILRSPADVTVLRTPSWWNVRHTLWLLGVTVGSLVALIGLVLILRRRLDNQMEIIRQKSRSTAVLEERNRIARELHDTLEQELAGITMQLDLAADCFQQAPQFAKQAVETARKMSRHSMVEARRSVWDLRCHLLENGDLVSALTQLLEPLANGDGSEVAIRVEGQPVRLSAPVEMNILRIGQEAVGNAVKHGRARNVRVDLRYDSDRVCLSVRDDGLGFTPADERSIGHFGLLDMRERAVSMGTQLQIESICGAGTEIRVDVPVVKNARSNAKLKTNLYSSG